ncbi:TIGR02281 family clan AA aspartic protease [Novosphingobium sp. FSY-8]|uniref:TIGR02281 family clan AA aspartic protease n=2 Tax=Novosphingobium ovatum TaxID=1908523 RepID=A0ABW9XAZ6_9SPHN|nr:TIGR02281 family clan AA aspartic protease [Novosphingobium ovatum]
MALVVLGGMVRRVIPWLGGLMRFIGNLGVIGVMLAVIMQVVAKGPVVWRSPAASAEAQQTITGTDTRIPLAGDNHFWVRAELNGARRRFLIDTGATLTTISPASARAAGIDPEQGGQTIVLNTANGTTTGTVVRLHQMRVGNIIARDLDVVIAPGMGDTNVLGMNFLTRLASWRVEGRTLILVPHHPQASPKP